MNDDPLTLLEAFADLPDPRLDRSWCGFYFAYYFFARDAYDRST